MGDIPDTGTHLRVHYCGIMDIIDHKTFIHTAYSASEAREGFSKDSEEGRGSEKTQVTRQESLNPSGPVRAIS